MSFLSKTVASLSALTVALPIAAFFSYKSAFQALPKSEDLKDITVVFTGSAGRIPETLRDFAAGCAGTDKQLIISGTGAKTTLKSFETLYRIDIPEECEKRTYVGNMAKNTAGNAIESRRAYTILNDGMAKAGQPKTMQLRTSWCHAPRAYIELMKRMSSDVSISVKFAGNCDLKTLKGKFDLAKEMVKRPFAGTDIAEKLSGEAIRKLGNFRIGHSAFANRIHH